MNKENLKKKQAVGNARYQERKRVVDYGRQRPIFSFYHMRYGKSYCLSKCSPDDKCALVTTLLKISQKTWNDISSTDRKTFGFEHMPIKKFNATVLPEIVTPDVKSLLVFAYSHGGRMAGIQHDNIFHILLVGTDIYPH